MSHAALNSKGLLSPDPFSSVTEVGTGECLFEWILRVEFSGGWEWGLLRLIRDSKTKFLRCMLYALAVKDELIHIMLNHVVIFSVL